jgi:hypothetical protein
MNCKTNAAKKFMTTLFAAAVAGFVYLPQAIAQEGGLPEGDRPNPLEGLYTPQPQYPTPQTIMNPEPVPKNFNPESGPSQSLTPPAPPPTTTPTQPATKPAGEAKTQPAKKKAPAKKGKKDNKAQQAAPPAPPPVYNPLKDALFNLNLGQYDAAIGIVDKLLQSDANNAEAHYVKAVALVYQQKFADAAYEYRKVMSISPNSELAARAEEGLKRVNH